MKQSRVKKLNLQDREKIKKLYNTKLVTYEKLAKMFNVSKGRISQIINDNYNESRFVEGGDNAET